MENKALEFRVTLSFCRNKIQHIYGVPVVHGTNKKQSATEYVKIQADRNQLPLEPSPGQQWVVEGEFTVVREVKNKRLYNNLLFNKPKSLKVTLPNKDEGFVKFISNEIDHVSESKADALWQAYGERIYAILENKDKERLLAVESIGNRAAESLIEGFEKYTNLKYCNWLSEFKVPLYVQRRIIKYHSKNTIDVIRANPYTLVAFGMPFKAVDELALTTFCVPKGSYIRLAAAVNQALTTLCRKQGHTYINEKWKLKAEIAKLIEQDYVDPALIAGKEKVTYISFKQYQDIFFHHDLTIMETAVAKRIAASVLASTALPLDVLGDYNEAFECATGELDYDLTDKQRNAVATSLFSNVSLITGGAGTGKTTVTRTVLRAYSKLGYDITAIALSGRAAMRLHQSIGFPTSTIARFIRSDPIEDCDQNGKEKKHILVIDESSMIDITSMYRVINHITPNCRLLFVGDPHQLPPIGAGLVLSELDSVAEIEKTHLDIVKRQEASSGIPEYSLSIREGNVPDELSTCAIEFHDMESHDRVVELYSKDPENSMAIAATKSSVDTLNKKIQAVINPNSPVFRYCDRNGQWYAISGSSTEGNEQGALLLRLNDPVIFVQNNYDAGYQNGSLGVLTSISDESEGHYGTVTLIDNNEEIRLTLPMLDHLRAAYAITLHKAQGSQFKNSIVYLDKGPMVDRSWLYTAVTRSEDSLHIVGTKERFEKAVKTQSAFSRRNARLGWLINQYIALHHYHKKKGLFAI